ncbi:DinB family protein [Frankia sp. AiPs1]|uniref:DinB family protein n=1 Tax=Frankia sp. AiPa1 TaxID=573492 RepID=UPI00202AEF07|nr:DinB family protein [Frankia sp. AiPa1]MCL9760427.1 DinB family protein [Frankia sp. AiPa1]
MTEPSPRPPTLRVMRASTAGEREVLESFLDFYRDVFVHKVRGVSDEDAARRVLPSRTTLTGLVRHLIEVERNWFHRLTNPAIDEEERANEAGGAEAGGAEAGGADPTDRADAEPPSSWDLDPADTLEAALADYDRACAHSRTSAAGFTLDDVVPQPELGQVSVRWIYVHMVEEIARHTGHADILRELTDGSTGELG